MADRILVVCPGCSAKLAVADASKLGKKIRCSKCSEVFVAKAASASGSKTAKSAPPAKAKKKSDDDEFNFEDVDMEDKSEFDDEESADEAPVAKSKAKTTGKAPVKKAKGKGKGKSGGNNLPLIIGGSAAVVLLISVGLYFLLSGNEPPAAAPVAPVAQQPAAPAGVPAPQNFPADRILALKWLPQDTELIVHLKLGDVWDAPLLKGVFGSPQVQPFVQQMQQFVGLAPTDIESITIGIRDLQEIQGSAMMMAMGGPPPANQMGLVVVRTKKAVDISAASSQIAQAAAMLGVKLADHSGKPYLDAPAAKPGEKAMGAWFADANTFISGPTDELFAAMDRGETIAPRNELRAVDPTPHLLFVVAPKNLQSMTQSAPISPGASPAAAEIQKSLQESLAAVSLGVSVRGGADLQTSLVCKDSAGSSKLKTSFEALITETKTSFAGRKSTTPPLLFELGEMLLNNVQITDQNQVVKLATSVPDSAQQKLEQLPTILLGAMMFGGGPFAGGPPGLSIGGDPGSFSDGFKKPGETEAVPATNAAELPPGSILTAKTAWKQFPEFGQNGQQSFNMELLVDLKSELITKASGFGRVSVKTITAVGGGAVKLAKHQFDNTPDPATNFLPFDVTDGFSFDHPEETLRVTIPFEPPNPPTAQLAAVDGEFKVQTAEKSEEIVIDDVRAVANKPLDNPALKAAETTLTLKVEDTPFGKREVLTISFAAGVATSQIGMSDPAKEGFTVNANREPMAAKPTFRLMPFDDSGKLPEKFKLTFKLHSGLKETAVPFRFENVPLPKPETMPKK